MPVEPQRIRVSISAPGDGDLSVVNAYRRLHGLPSSALVWSCQHSCAPDTIPTCTDSNCEASCSMSDTDIAEIRGLVARGDLTAFDDVVADYTVSGPAELIEEMSARLPKARASLLVLARFAESGDALDPLRAATAEALRSSFYYAARALLDQRVVDRRTPADSTAFMVFATNGDFPRLAYVAFGEGPSLDRYENAVGLDDEGDLRFGAVKAGASRVPGDQYGPRRRVVVRVDRGTLSELLARAESHVTRAAGTDAGDACVACFADLAAALGLPDVQQDNDIADPFLRVSRYVARLMRAMSF